MKTSKKGIELIKKYEGFRADAYKCPAGVWTIGYGHTAGVKKGDKVTEEEAEKMLKKDLVRAEKNVMYYDDIYHWTYNEFDALVSFAFNIGSIQQLTAKGTRSKELISNKMLEYCHAGGKKLKGLVKRRQEEREMFLGL